MRGGKFIAEGSYGCVYGNPPLMCNNKRLSNEYIVKVMGKDNAYEELADGNIMRRIDPKNEFSIYPVDVCKITKVDEKNDNCLRDCALGDVSRRVRACVINKKRPIHGLIMKNGGYDLDLSKKKSVVNSIFNRHTNYLIKPMYNIIRGIHKMNKTHVHLDMKGYNILYNEEQNKFYLIDFGLLSPIEDLFTKTNQKVISRQERQIEYFVYPVDFGIINSMKIVFDICKEIYTHERVFTDPSGELPDIKLIHIIKLLFNRCPVKENRNWTLNCPCLNCNNIRNNCFRCDPDNIVQPYITSLNESINNLLVAVEIIKKDKADNLRTGWYEDLNIFTAMPHFVKDEHKEKQKFYETLFNGVFGVTLKTLFDILYKVTDKDSEDGVLEYHVLTPTILFFQMIMCYFSEISFNHSKIEKDFHKTFKINPLVLVEKIPNQNLQYSQAILDRYVEKSRKSVDTYGLSKALLSIVSIFLSLLDNNVRIPLHKRIYGEDPSLGGEYEIHKKKINSIWKELILEPYFVKTVDFINILALLSHESLEKRLVLNEDVLEVLEYLVSSTDTTPILPAYPDGKRDKKGRLIKGFTYNSAMKRYQELRKLIPKKEIGFFQKFTNYFLRRDSDEDEVVVKPKLKLKPRKTKKPKLKLKPRKVKSVCGINPKTGYCKRGENTNIDKCMVNKNGNCAKKI